MATPRHRHLLEPILRPTALVLALALAGCTSTPTSPGLTLAEAQELAANAVREALRAALPSGVDATRGAPATADAPPAADPADEPGALRSEVARAVSAADGARDPRFSVNFAIVQPEIAFMAILRDSPLSVAVDPALKTPLSISLKDVTVREALEVLRELHGFDYQLMGRQLVVRPGELATRMYRVSYPTFNRNGRSEIRVVSGSITGGAGGGSGGVQSPSATTGVPSAPQSGPAGGGAAAESSRVTTAMRNDVWSEIEQSVRLLVGDKDGRSVVISPQTGTIIVRAMPREQRAVAKYLESARLSIERQVMLEAKIVEVQLRESVATGVNWAAFRSGSQRISAGVLNPGAQLSVNGQIGSANVTADLPGQAIEAASTLSGGLLGLAFQAANFAAVLEFLGTQGNVQVLSSPRIATMNNQKAVLKVGTDDFFVTNISTTTSSTGNTSQTSPNISVQPFFSGIALDVTPHIDDQGFIVLHVHPAVSNVGERNKVLNLGSLGSFTLPLASSDVSETDSVVRARDGKIIAIGGLMRTASRGGSSGIPGLGDGALRTVLGGRSEAVIDKRELVILLKPTIVDPSSPEAGLQNDPLARIEQMLRERPGRPLGGEIRGDPGPSGAARPAVAAPGATTPSPPVPPAAAAADGSRVSPVNAGTAPAGAAAPDVPPTPLVVAAPPPSTVAPSTAAAAAAPRLPPPVPTNRLRPPQDAAAAIAAAPAPASRSPAPTLAALLARPSGPWAPLAPVATRSAAAAVPSTAGPSTAGPRPAAAPGAVRPAGPVPAPRAPRTPQAADAGGTRPPAAATAPVRGLSAPLLAAAARPAARSPMSALDPVVVRTFGTASTLPAAPSSADRALGATGPLPWSSPSALPASWPSPVSTGAPSVPTSALPGTIGGPRADARPSGRQAAEGPAHGLRATPHGPMSAGPVPPVVLAAAARPGP